MLKQTLSLCDVVIAVATLLNQMHELVAENERLEEQVKALKSHRDHLLSTNSRLATPFSLTDEIVELSAPDSLQVSLHLSYFPDSQPTLLALLLIFASWSMVHCTIVCIIR